MDKALIETIITCLFIMYICYIICIVLFKGSGDKKAKEAEEVKEQPKRYTRYYTGKEFREKTPEELAQETRKLVEALIIEQEVSQIMAEREAQSLENALENKRRWDKILNRGRK